MTTRELIAELSKLDQDALVVMASDAEGNAYSPLHAAYDDRYRAETTWRGELIGDGEIEDWEDEKEVVSCVVLFPVN